MYWLCMRIDCRTDRQMHVGESAVIESLGYPLDVPTDRDCLHTVSAVSTTSRLQIQLTDLQIHANASALGAFPSGGITAGNAWTSTSAAIALGLRFSRRVTLRLLRQLLNNSTTQSMDYLLVWLFFC